MDTVMNIMIWVLLGMVIFIVFMLLAYTVVWAIGDIKEWQKSIKMTKQELIKNYEFRIKTLRKEILKLKTEVELIEAFIRYLEKLRDE